MEVVYKRAETDAEIKDWVEKNGGRPAIIDDPEVSEDAKGLRIDWPGQKDEAMLSSGREVTRDVSWDEFFTLMKTHQLGFLYSDNSEINPTWRYKFENQVVQEDE